MVDTPLEKQLIEQVRRMTAEQQQRLLDYAANLQTGLPAGIPGEVLAARAHQIAFPKQDMDEIKQAIEEDCERIDLDGWE